MHVYISVWVYPCAQDDSADPPAVHAALAEHPPADTADSSPAVGLRFPREPAAEPTAEPAAEPDAETAEAGFEQWHRRNVTGMCFDASLLIVDSRYGHKLHITYFLQLWIFVVAASYIYLHL